MTRRRKIIKHRPDKVVSDTVNKIKASGEIWASNTSSAFETGYWRRRIKDYFIPDVVRQLHTLPAHRPGKIDANIERTRRVAHMVRDASERYRNVMITRPPTGVTGGLTSLFRLERQIRTFVDRQLSQNSKPKVGQRIIRGLFAGVSVGLVGGFGLYFMAQAVNMLANKVVIDPIAILLLSFGVVVTAAVSIELSKDME